MPVAVTTMAKALNVTTQELDAMMKRGELVASEALPKFAKELRRVAHEGGAVAAGMKSITAAQNRMNTVWKTAIDQMMESGGKEGIVSIFDALSSVIKSLTPTFKTLGIVLKWVGFIFKMTIIPAFSLFSAAAVTTQSVLQALDANFSRLGARIKKAIQPLTDFIEKMSVVRDILFGEKNIWDATTDVMFGTDKGKVLKQRMQQALPTPGSKSIPTKPSGQGNNIIVNFTANGTDPSGVYQEFDKFFQGTIRGIATGAN